MVEDDEMSARSDTVRANRANARLRAAGGKMTSVRLSPEAVERIGKIVAAGLAANQTQAIEMALEGALRQMERNAELVAALADR